MEHCAQGDLLITMGAGDVVNVGENLLAKVDALPEYI